MGLSRHSCLKRHFYSTKHGLFVMLEHQGQDIDHLAIATGPAQHLILQLPERFWHLNEGRTVP